MAVVPGSVFQVRMCWSLFGHIWQNTVHVAHVSGSASNLAEDISRATWFSNTWQSNLLKLCPSTTAWFENQVAEVTGGFRHLGRFPVPRVGSIVAEQALAANHALPYTLYATDSDPPGYGRFYWSGLSEQLFRSVLVNETRLADLQNLADSWSLPMVGNSVTVRHAVRLSDGLWHFVDQVRYSPRVAILHRRTRQSCETHAQLVL